MANMFELEISQLATAVQSAVTEYKKKDSIPTRRIARVRRRDLSLKYHEDFGFAHFPPERIEEDVWEWSDQQRFQESALNGLQEYKSLASLLGGKAVGLETFVHHISSASFQGLGDMELAERATAFAHELSGQALPVKLTAFLDGLSILESPLAISNNYVFRRPTEEDVAECIFLDEHGGHAIPLGETWFRVVGEFTFEVISTGLAQMEFLRMLEALQLFRVGGVGTNRYRMESLHSFLQGGIATMGGGYQFSRFAYQLSQSDAVSLNAFLKDIMPVLPDPLHLDKNTSERAIAYTRYKDALFQGGPAERTITSAITALEALFLENEGELKRRLAQRVSVFLRELGTQADPYRCFEYVSEGYKIRSTFIHGGSLKATRRTVADSLVPIILEYARECVLAFFQIKTPKDELLTQLDRTMIDPASVNDLRVSLKAVVYH
jgi:hypothetical protein